MERRPCILGALTNVRAGAVALLVAAMVVVAVFACAAYVAPGVWSSLSSPRHHDEVDLNNAVKPTEPQPPAAHRRSSISLSRATNLSSSVERLKSELLDGTHRSMLNPVRGLYLSGSDSRSVNIGHELQYETFVRFMGQRLSRFRNRHSGAPLPSLLVTELHVDSSSCQLDQSQAADVADGLAAEQADFVVLGGGSMVRDRALCVLWRLLNQRPELPVFFWGSGFDDTALVTANRNIMHNLRNNRFQNVQFSPTSVIALASSAIFGPALVSFGGVRGNYSTQFISRMAPASPVRSAGEAGLLFDHHSFVDRPSSSGATTRLAQQVLLTFGSRFAAALKTETTTTTTTTTNDNGTSTGSGTKSPTSDDGHRRGDERGRGIVMVNFGIPTEGVSAMYGKHAQISTVAAALIKVMQTLSLSHTVLLYATSTTDLVHLRTLYNATVHNVDVEVADVNRIIMAPSVPDVRVLLHALEHSVLSIAFRYHAVMLSVRARVPLVALAYRFKVRPYPCERERVRERERESYKRVFRY